MKIIQHKLKLKPYRRGFHLITDEIEAAIPELNKINAGLCQIFIQHTSASLTINENADPSVRSDFETFISSLIPDDYRHFKHTTEGSDDITAHIKSSLLGSSLLLPISNGNFALGTWQGIYLCEHRNSQHSRSIIITIFGE